MFAITGCDMTNKPRIYLTSNVFKEIGSNEDINQNIRKKIKTLWDELKKISILDYFDGRFPTKEKLKEIIKDFNPEILGCHLSHSISSEMLENSKLFAISTSTAGYNHIQRNKDDDILITHTPGVLHETVADYTIALIMATLRNLIDLHQYLWYGLWTPKDKWDLDQNLSTIINNKVLGIIGLGEIGKHVIKRLYHWGIKIIYYDIIRWNDFEKNYPKIEFRSNIEDVFREANVVSLHIPLNESTNKLINRDLLKLMKRDALLVNTARGDIINFDDLLNMYEKKEIQINIAFDVYPQEPIDVSTLERLKNIKREQSNIRMVLMPHNASSDADTRGKMVIQFFEDLIKIVKSLCIADLKLLNVIPEQKKQLAKKKWRIYNYWNKKS